ncbi:putative RNA methyltransferase [Zhihengliuella flava]|uniref:23S rRNA (Guanine745-N1)-methyltransferase n=1 Tax=Zhihengliuella flava TaxID=1285193 RepID=A0A931D7F0_9MICC|nr:SAM-dependent methyltransferase [Zhihengliuella flava]MBG6083383.1 23S rRNA (guanine745-N1)-methyltransferase [Zhihengliuella flava]
MCTRELQRVEARRLECASGHRFDAAKQGYFNFLTGRGTTFREDTASMVAARADFQSAGHYEPLADRVAELVAEHFTVAGAESGEGRQVKVLDVGAGTGYYLGRVLTRMTAPSGDRQGAVVQQSEPPPRAIAMDISRYAMRRAAKIPGVLAVVWDVWRAWPIADASADVVLNIFAPRNGDEFVRTVRPGGLAVVVTPLANHLREVAEPLELLEMADDKERAVRERLGDLFEEVASERVSGELKLSRTDAVRLSVMGPAGHHVDPASLEARLRGLPEPLRATAAFRIQVLRRRAVSRPKQNRPEEGRFGATDRAK